MNLTFLKPWANQCVFLMEMFFLTNVNEIMYLLWNLSFFKMIPPNFFSFLKPWADNSSTNQYSYQLLHGSGMTHLCHPISKMPVVGKGHGETPSALRCLSYLINSFLTDIRQWHPHSSTLAWKIPWMEEPGRLQSMGWLRVGHDWVTSLALFTFMHCRRKWKPAPVFLPGESQGQGSSVGCRLWGCTESDMTEAT